MASKILISLGIIVSILIAVIGYGYRSATKLPDNDPQAFLKSGIKKNGKVVVCVGDSITHGRVSHNYVDELDRRFQSENYVFINAGINSQLAYNVLQRLDEIVQCQPDYITILIGTNDAQATLSEKKASHFIKEMNLPRIPNRQWYKENLTSIIDHLQKETKAKIVLLTLPPITEDRQHPGYQRVKEYSSVIKQTAAEYGIHYLPLNESIDKALAKKGNDKRSQFVIGNGQPLYLAILYHNIFGNSWDEIAQKNGQIYLTDNIHLSGKGALVVTDLIEKFIRTGH